MNPQDNKRGLVASRFLFILGFILVLIIMTAYFFYGLQPSFAVNNPVKFTVTKGESFKEIGARLSQSSLIKSIVVFKVYSLLTGSATRFQPGVYELAGTMSVPQIVGLLRTGSENDVTIQIPDGATVKDIDQILSDKGVIQKGSLENFNFASLATQYPFLSQVNSLEGFLMPDTYNFNLDSDTSDVVKKFLDTFEIKAWPLLSGEKSWYNDLILASYLEREVPEFNDRKIVAGILLKRIQINMPLQVDATLSYAKCDGRLFTCENMVPGKGDTKINSPYNTYLHSGFTPTPIANPSKHAIQAAISPESSNYLYYFSNASGTIFFSRTLEEHNQKQLKYL